MVQKRKPISLQREFWNVNALFEKKLEVEVFMA